MRLGIGQKYEHMKLKVTWRNMKFMSSL